MPKALWYIYRNLHKDCFSVKYKGKVVDYIDLNKPIILLGYFKVNPAGRASVLVTGKKMVHAYVVAEHKVMRVFYPEEWEGFKKREVTYNPFKHDYFVFKDTGEVAEGNLIILEYPKVYCLTP